MGLPSLLVGQPNTSPKKNDEGFYPIQLSSSPILNGASGLNGPCGATFTGIGTTTDDPLSCSGRYSFLNTDHQSIAGLTSDGDLLFVLNSRVGGKRYSIAGAFGPKGDPKTPTKVHENIFAKYMAKDSKLIVLDAKSSGALGVKTNGPNPGGGIYVGNNQFILDLHVAAPLGGKTTLEANGTATTDWNGKLQSRGLNLKLANGGNSVAGSLQQSGKQLTRQVDATAGDWTLSGKLTTAPGQRTRELDVSYKASEQLRFTFSAKPDNRPPARMPAPTAYEISHPGPAPDYSQFKLTVEYRFH